jgi:hypothetical protein
MPPFSVDIGNQINSSRSIGRIWLQQISNKVSQTLRVSFVVHTGYLPVVGIDTWRRHVRHHVVNDCSQTPELAGTRPGLGVLIDFLELMSEFSPKVGKENLLEPNTTA